MALYTSVWALIDRACGKGTSTISICSDSLSIYSLKIAVAYCDTVDQSAEGKPLIQRSFLTGLAKRVDEILSSPSLFTAEAQNPELKPCFHELFSYLDSRKFPLKQARQSDYELKRTSTLDTRVCCILFSCFLCWYGIPQPKRIIFALQQLVQEVPGFQNIMRSNLYSALPVLALALPSTPLPALLRISECLPFLSLAKFSACMEVCYTDATSEIQVLYESNASAMKPKKHNPPIICSDQGFRSASMLFQPPSVSER